VQLVPFVPEFAIAIKSTCGEAVAEFIIIVIDGTVGSSPSFNGLVCGEV
jgi:hypothetical protein